jgi:hypothetical protein
LSRQLKQHRSGCEQVIALTSGHLQLRVTEFL